MSIKPKISGSVSKQLPEFIREDYQTFVSFLEAYYEFLDENYTKRNLKELRDIDETLDSFLDYFKNEINCALYFGFDNCTTLNKRIILQRLKSYYNAKGSEAGLKFVMRLLYNKDPEIFYPGSLILRASDGRWQQDLSFFLEIDEGVDITDFVGSEVTLYRDGVAQTTLFVDRYIYAGNNIYEIFVQRYSGTIIVGDIVRYDGIAGVVTGTTTNYEILSGGSGFKVGQIFDIESAEGSGTKIKITQVSSTGEIQKVQIVKFGTGFNTDFVSQIAPADGSVITDPSPISVSKNSVEQFSVPSNTYTNGFEEEGFIVTPDYWTLDYCADGTYAGTAITTFKNMFEAGLDTTKLSSIKFTISASVKYPGYYSSNNGFISDSIFIQDSKYYQAFSYVIKIDELLDEYIDIIKSFGHPAGMALFAEYGIYQNFDMTASVIVAENIIRLGITDTIAPLDSITKDITFSTISNTVNIGESLVYQLNKDGLGSFTEGISESDSGGVFLNSYTEGAYFSEDYATSESAVATF